VWVAIQRHGASGLAALYEHLCATARALYDAILGRPAFQALHAPESNILCFRYVGNGALPDNRLDALNLDLRTAFNREGDGWITSTVLGGRRVLRVTMMNPRTTPRDLDRVLNGLETVGARLLRAS
jgi:L-2,4-diaminobutyrate decarboxylase